MIPHTSPMRAVIGGLSTFWLALYSAQALDLTPQYGTRQGNEGPATETMIFTDGAARYGFVPPAGWKSSGGGKSLSFFTHDTTSWMRLMVIAKGKPQQAVDTAAPKTDLQEWSAQFIPSGAEKAEFVKMVPSPFPVGTHPSTEYVYTFMLSGFRYSLSVSVVDFSEKERLVMLVSAGSKNFEQIRREAISSMFSWASEE